MSLDASFHALDRYTCRKVLDILRRGPQSVTDIHSHFRIGSRASVSQALALLLDADMVTARRQGRNTIYQLRSAPFTELIHYVEGVKRDAQKGSR